MGARALDSGGNAADAAVAATLTVFLAAPMMTSAAGGGLAVVDDGPRGTTEMLDFFPRVPGLPAARLEVQDHDFVAVPVRYAAGVEHVFHVGRAAAAAPAALAGLLALHRRHGRLELPRLLAPVIARARAGVTVRAIQAHFHRLFEAVLRHGTCRRLFAPGGRLLGTGQRLTNPAYAEALAWVAAHGRDPLTQGYLAEPLLGAFGPPEGFLTEEDLAAVAPRPGPVLRVRYRHAEVLLPGTPSEGGALVALGLSLLAAHEAPADPRGARQLRLLAAAERTALEARARQDVAGLVHPEAAARWRPRFEELVATGGRAVGSTVGPTLPLPGNTSHVSAVDEAGLAVAVTTSFGETCGHLVPGLGLAMNNLLGEAEINPRGFHADPPGSRLVSMMTPCVVRREDGSRVALGTGGAERIPGQVLGAVVRAVDHGMAPAQLLAEPRIHASPRGARLEVAGLAPLVLAELTTRLRGADLFGAPDLYFGGLHLAALDARGAPDAAGDRRRDGRGALGGAV